MKTFMKLMAVATLFVATGLEAKQYACYKCDPKGSKCEALKSARLDKGNVEAANVSDAFEKCKAFVKKGERIGAFNITDANDKKAGFKN